MQQHYYGGHRVTSSANRSARTASSSGVVASPEVRHHLADANAVYGMLFLAGAIAASRADDRGTTRVFLSEADQAARRLGADANHMWTAFGPTNVAIHRVATAMELGDFQVAIDLSSRIDASAMPVERRIRHALDIAHAHTARRRTDQATEILLRAERVAPEQVRYHAMSRQLVVQWLRQCRGTPSRDLGDLARRMRLVA
jgi:hypothetical protein